MITKKHLIKHLDITRNVFKKHSRMSRDETKLRLDMCDTMTKLIKDAYIFDLGNADDIVDDVDKVQEVTPKEYRIPFPVTLLECMFDRLPQENNPSVTQDDYLVVLLVELETLAKMDKSFTRYIKDYSFGIFSMSPVNIIDAGNYTWYIPSFNCILMPYNPEIQPEVITSVTNEIIDTTRDLEISLVKYFCNILICKNVEVRVKEEKPVSKLLSKNKIPERVSDIIIKLPGRGIVYENRTINEIKFNERRNIGVTGQKRGHFKTFTEERPLFGKYVGTWWWSPVFQTRKRNYVVEINADSQ